MVVVVVVVVVTFFVRELVKQVMSEGKKVASHMTACPF